MVKVGRHKWYLACHITLNLSEYQAESMAMTCALVCPCGVVGDRFVHTGLGRSD